LIAYLRGKIQERGEDTIVLDVGGVGYQLQCSNITLEQVFEREEVEVWVQTYLREDAISLFGFATKVEREMFLSLVKVNGVGPKMAIKILSGASLDRLAAMIEASDVKGLSNLPKVGKKTAEQLILSLKGKLVLASDDLAPNVKNRASARASSGYGARSDLVSALVNLGFRPVDVERVVADIAPGTDLQQGLRQGLQALTGQISGQL
jgi:Holliday junction DNA helicase RuvA